VRKLLSLSLTSLLLLAGCGGSGTTTTGGGGGGGDGGGGGGGGSQVIATPGPPNVETITVDGGPTQLTTTAVNTAYLTVTVCVPNTNQCQNIDHIEVDTGSIGLRILADAVTSNGTPFSLALPAVQDPTNASNVLAECLEFADGFSWGSVNAADISLPVSGESATNVTVHVIGAASAGDPNNANPSCVPPPPLVTENTVPSFGANGILGVGPFVNDCNSTGDCDPLAQVCSGGHCYPGNSATYFTCTAAPSCTQVAKGTINAQQQLPNPAVLFANDNNGVIVELPAVGASGMAPPVNGSLVFGIGTQANNSLGSATKLEADPASGVISASLNMTSYPDSYLDSGSNANFFPTSIASCPQPNQGFLCPPATTDESATLQGTNGSVLTADFSVANANTLFTNDYAAFSNLAGNNTASNTSVDLGLSFFYGRNVFTGFENPGVSAPYFAY